MATEYKYADAHITGDCDDPNNALGVADDTWTTDSGAESWTSRWSMQNPSGAITGTQLVQIYCKKSALGGNDPTVSMDLYEDGVWVKQILAPSTVTSETGGWKGGNFDASEISDPNDVQIRVVATYGGSGGNARTVVIDTITWTVNLAAAGVTADLNSTLGAATLAGTGKVGVTADLSATLGAATLAGTADVDVTAALTKTLDALTAAGSASVTDGPVGDLSVTLAALTAAGTGKVGVSAALDATLAALTAAGTGEVGVLASLTQTLAALTLSGTASVASGPTADLAVTLDALTAAGTASVPITADASNNLAALTLSGSATVLSPPHATLNVTLAALTLYGIAHMPGGGPSYIRNRCLYNHPHWRR